MARCASATAAPKTVRLIPRLLRLAAAGGVAALLTGCAGGGLLGTTGDFTSSVPAQPVMAASYTSGGAPSDWDAIAEAAPEAFGAAAPAGVAWFNPLTGTGGTLASLAVPAAGGADCRAFTVSMSDWLGVRRYRGEACHASSGGWAIVAAFPEDADLA